MYKITNSMVGINPGGLIQPTSTVTRGHSMKFKQLQTNKDAIIYPSPIRLWNNLPSDHVVVISPSLAIESFKNKLNM